MSNLEEQQILEVENRYWVEKWESLERLRQNKDFQNLILEGYFKDRAINGVSLLGQDSIIRDGHRPKVIEDLVAISKLEDFFITVENLGTVPLESAEDSE